MASDVPGQLHRDLFHHDEVKEEVELECACDERRWMWRQSGVQRRDYNEVEIAGEIGPTVYVGRDFEFLKDHVYCVNVSLGSESSNVMVLS